MVQQKSLAPTVQQRKASQPTLPNVIERPPTVPAPSRGTVETKFVAPEEPAVSEVLSSDSDDEDGDESIYPNFFSFFFCLLFYFLTLILFTHQMNSMLKIKFFACSSK